MKSHNQTGKVLDLAAPYDRLSGQGALIGSIFGVACHDVLNGVTGTFMTEEVHTLAKTDSQAWLQGDTIYWDNTNKRCDNTCVGPAIGTATAAVAATPGLTTGAVKLKEAPAKPPSAALPAFVVTVPNTQGGATPTAAQVDTGIRNTVDPLIVRLNTIQTALAAAGIVLA